jgi:hypothetical protein
MADARIECVLFKYDFGQRLGLGQPCCISRFGAGGERCRGDESQTIVPGGTSTPARHRELGDTQQLRAAGHIGASHICLLPFKKMGGKCSVRRRGEARRLRDDEAERRGLWNAGGNWNNGRNACA